MRILYLSFYFEPDLCAGSFRNTPLAYELAKQFASNGSVDVYTTMPNRYNSYLSDASINEQHGNLFINRIKIPIHKGGFIDQINSFQHYFRRVRKMVSKQDYNMVFASSSRLFTAYLGYTVAKEKNIPLYLDIRDIFTDTIGDVIANPIIRLTLLPILRLFEYKTFSYACHINLISEGFRNYFSKYKNSNFSYFTNGIDEKFLESRAEMQYHGDILKILYAGNIGEGQGLHKIIPKAAKLLGNKYSFEIIGDGSAKGKLLKELEHNKVQNVIVSGPLGRDFLKRKYLDADFLMLHLNNYEAFKKVLPSKIFELASYDKPLIAGVSGYSMEFIQKNIPNHILFQPGDVKSFVEQILNFHYKLEYRTMFIEKFRRTVIDQQIVKSVISYIL
jgi:hypothetical protein